MMLCKKYLIYVTGQFIPMATVVLPSNYSEFKSRWFKSAIYLQRYCYYFAAHKLLLPVSCNKLCEFYVRDGSVPDDFNDDLRLTQFVYFPVYHRGFVGESEDSPMGLYSRGELYPR